MKPRALRLLFLLGGCGALLHAAQLYRSLPARVASHFNGAGNATGWMPRGGFVGIYAGVIVLISVVFLTVAVMLEKMPDNKINLPKKAYWLDPVRRAQTFEWIRGWFYLFGLATTVFVIAIMHLVWRFNSGQSPTLGTEAPWLMVAYLACVVFMVAKMILHFSREK